jgi:hypothetical protein
VKIRLLDHAHDDLLQGHAFYEKRGVGLGSYFLDCLFSDIDSLLVYAGVHQIVFGYHRSLSKRFPFAIYYLLEGETVTVYAVLDCRRRPAWVRRRLRR